MATQKAAFTMRMQPENLDKIKVLAAINKRSMAMQIEYLVEQYIRNYESQHGTIPLVDNNNVNISVNNQAQNCVANVQMQ